MPNCQLEQFAIIPLIPMNIGNLYFSFTNPSLFMLLTLSLVLLLVHFITKKGGGNSVPNAWQSLVELIYDFVLNPINEQIGGLSGNVKQKFSPRILVTFIFLLFRNLQGMIPYSFTITSHFLITLGLPFSIFIGITIVGFQRNGLYFLSFSLPAGVPLLLAPFLVLLELMPLLFLPIGEIQYVTWEIVVDPDYMGLGPSSSESRLFQISIDKLSRELFPTREIGEVCWLIFSKKELIRLEEKKELI